MFSNRLFLLGISTLFAAIPAIIWLAILFKKTEKSKKTIALIFGLGSLTAPALLGLQYVWDAFPRFNLAAFITDNIQSQSTMFIFMFVLFGAMEEIIKHYVISGVDKKTTYIKTINDTIRYSLAAALGFSFTENIYYLFQFWPSISTGQLVGMYMFRSIFTACAHMIFSGIFGYYYAMGKFSIYIAEQQALVGDVSKGTRFIAKLFNLPVSHAYQQKMVLKGLLIAIVMHAAYNFVLQFNLIYPVVIFVILGFLYLRYLLKRKAGHLILTTDITSKRPSTIAKKDEDVIIELMGMWFKQKNYVDVIHVCERLLERDPDNNIVKLFKAKAMDKMEDRDTYKKVLGSVVKVKEDLNQKEKNILSKYLDEKEMFRKVKKMIQKQVEKEGKEYKEEKKKNSKPKLEAQKQKTILKTKKAKHALKKYTGDGTFKLKK